MPRTSTSRLANRMRFRPDTLRSRSARDHLPSKWRRNGVHLLALLPRTFSKASATPQQLAVMPAIASAYVASEPILSALQGCADMQQLKRFLPLPDKSYRLFGLQG